MGNYLTRFPENAPYLCPVGRYRALLVGIYDGDTQTYIIRFQGKYFKIKVRVADIDTPELYNGNIAKIRAAELIGKNKLVTLICRKPDKYGRILAEVITRSGVNLGQQLLKEGLAKPYPK